MHARYILVALAAPALITGAAIPQDPEIPDTWDENSSDIVGGVAANRGDVPFMVSLRVEGFHICGGNLINAMTVVTAAHCLFGGTNASFSVRAGSLDRDSGGIVSNVSSIRVHPRYNDTTLDYDVAILKLSTPIATSSTIGYAKIAAQGSDPAVGSIVTTAGWGDTSENGTSSTRLLKVDVPVVSRAICRANYSNYSEVTDRMFCAGFSAGGKDSCNGDSGGPIFSSSKTLLGLVSWGVGCARPDRPGVYSRIGAFSSFITSNS